MTFADEDSGVPQDTAATVVELVILLLGLYLLMVALAALFPSYVG